MADVLHRFLSAAVSLVLRKRSILALSRSFEAGMVPTPHMGLCGVLTGLVADHLDPEEFRGLWNDIDNAGWRPPACAGKDLLTIGKGGVGKPLRIWEWYFWEDE